MSKKIPSIVVVVYVDFAYR